MKYWHFPLTTSCGTQCNSSEKKLDWASVGFEPTTCCLHDNRSNQLNYQATDTREASFLISISQSSRVWSITPSYVLLHHSVNIITLYTYTCIYLISSKVFNKWILPKFSGFPAILFCSSTSYFITSLWTSLVTFATSFLTFVYICHVNSRSWVRVPFRPNAICHLKSCIGSHMGL